MNNTNNSALFSQIVSQMSKPVSPSNVAIVRAMTDNCKLVSDRANKQIVVGIPESTVTDLTDIQQADITAFKSILRKISISANVKSTKRLARLSLPYAPNTTPTTSPAHLLVEFEDSTTRNTVLANGKRLNGLGFGGAFFRPDRTPSEQA